MLKIETVRSIEVSDWDALVRRTYGRPYSLQQQDGCKARGIEKVSVPCAHPWDYETSEMDVGDEEMGVSFAAWLARSAPMGSTRPGRLLSFWERNFYPSLEMVASDLHARGLLPEGEYQIVIDW